MYHYFLLSLLLFASEILHGQQKVRPVDQKEAIEIELKNIADFSSNAAMQMDRVEQEIVIHADDSIDLSGWPYIFAATTVGFGLSLKARADLQQRSPETKELLDDIDRQLKENDGEHVYIHQSDEQLFEQLPQTLRDKLIVTKASELSCLKRYTWWLKYNKSCRVASRGALMGILGVIAVTVLNATVVK